ncbi:MAG: tRNA 2-selenouridine(34) synthase MnmH [gamma proteobacterium symbiont of Lucinoma myriamae]|nr:tRNA 2-selenouridine(34) synthase MnmH [gamma proteobacterium symbiont of Lucinoma myriamae]MCU7817900.1 tRNA 2-selenouridine(34) synthase MnmH [gamma proteobacterium symbiont of Lucinoma myriamae]MCU7832831.1 tRNA 2-selenouridine(34) synthase MnmH [gamma proteobacterium symbiont of Lucinoma myriamae]
MSNPIDRDLIRSLFLHDTPLMDVRAPVEFAQGAFPCAVNHPLMNDQERHDVGLRYKQQGQDAAIKLGNKLVSGDIKEQRIAQWQAFAREHPDGYLYCFRGGLRSRTTQQWLKESGVDLPLVNGGYKAMRRVLIDELEQSIADSQFIILGGKTGTGKTWLLKELSGAIDLEGFAHHRGSSFGRFPDGQPSQINFENTLAIALMKNRSRGVNQFWLEDEGRLIGSLSLPQSLQKKMKQSPLVLLEEDLQYRISITLKDYVIDLEEYYRTYYKHRDLQTNNTLESDEPFKQFSSYLLDSLARIKKRLGGERYQKVEQQMQDALKEQKSSGNIVSHRIWIESLLTTYYDPMYEYQLESKQQRLIFRGNSHQILANQKKILDLD